MAAVTAVDRPIWSNETPPSMAAIMKTGSPATKSMNTLSKLAKSFPRTSSLLESRVGNKRMSVFLSFSCPTAPATNVAEKNIASAS